MDVKTNETENGVVITLEGKMMLGYEANDFHEAIENAIDRDKKKIVVDLSNEQTTKLFQKATNSTRANALNIVGQYEYMESGVLTGGGKDNPVKINRINNSTLGVTGKIWNWDFDAGKGVYRDLQEDVLDRLNLNFESPENLQVFIDLAYKTAQKDYDQYMPKVTK